MVRRNCDRSFNAMSMDEFDDSELICGSESSDQADLTFFCGTFSRLVHMTEEQSEKCGSMEAMLVEIQNTLSQLSNQLGIHPIEAETSRQTLPVPYSDPYIRDAHSRFPLDNSTSLLPEFDGSNASDWLSKVERFFRVGRYSDLDKLDLVAFSLEGDVLKWFNWEMTRNAFHTWDEFRRRLFLRFAATPEASSETVTDNLEARASYQVPVSSLEPGLSFSNESLVVSEAIPSEIVSNNRVHSQFGFECVKNKNNAHHVLDELLLRRHKLQQRKKPSLSPKSRMFKFKNRFLLSNWSQKDLHQVIDISKVNNLSPCFRANFGWVRQKKTIQCLRLTKQAHKSRVLYHLRMLHDPGGKDDEHSVDITYSQLSDEHKASACAVVKCSETATYAPAMQTEGWDEACAAARDALERTGTWIVTSLPANNIEEALLKVVTKPVTEGTTTRFKEVFMTLAAPVSQLNCFNLPLHHVPNNGLLVFPCHLLFLEFFLSIHLEDKVCLSGASNSWCGWMVFDRGKNIIISEDVITLKRDGQKMLLVKAKDVHVDSLVVRMKLILGCGVALEKQIQWAEIQRLSLYKELWIENMVEITTGVSWAELKWIIWSVISTIVEAAKVNVNFETRHGVCIILIFKSEPTLEGNHEMRGLLGISMSCFGDTGSVLVMVLYFNLEGKKWYTKRQQTSSSTWHRWRRKD